MHPDVKCHIFCIGLEVFLILRNVHYKVNSLDENMNVSSLIYRISQVHAVLFEFCREYEKYSTDQSKCYRQSSHLLATAIAKEFNLLKYHTNFWFWLDYKLVAQLNKFNTHLSLNKLFADVVIIILRQMPQIYFTRFLEASYDDTHFTTFREKSF